MWEMSRRFLVLHGWENHRPPGHWQHWLTERLRSSGEQVLYPQLPSPDEPVFDDWLAVLRAELEMLGDGERVVLCHSLACLLWLRHAETAGPEHAVDRLLLVCPPGVSALPHALSAFFPGPRSARALPSTSRTRPVLVCTDADPWCAEGAAATYGGALDVDVHLVPGGGHLALEDGYGPWPAVERWALHGACAPAALAA